MKSLSAKPKHLRVYGSTQKRHDSNFSRGTQPLAFSVYPLRFGTKYLTIESTNNQKDESHGRGL